MSELTAEETLRLPGCGCAPKFSPQPAFILYISCAKISQGQRELWLCFCSYHFFYSVWLSSHFQLLNSTYISRSSSVCLSSQVKRWSRPRKVEVTEPSGVRCARLVSSVILLVNRVEGQPLRDNLGFLCLLLQARRTWPPILSGLSSFVLFDCLYHILLG